jgi:uncharacterized RDD family membrane protein YckC
VELPDDHEINLASRWARLGAALIDGLSVLPITLPTMYFTGGFDVIKTGVPPSLLYNLAIATLMIVAFAVIHGAWLISDGQTMGKKVMGIKIVTNEGGHVDLMTLVKRYGFYLAIPQIPAIGPFINLVNTLFIFSKSKRCLHDHFADTQVIVAKTSP